MSIATAPRLAPPRITATMLSAARLFRAGVIVQEDTGATYAAERLAVARADNPSVVVLLDQDEVGGFLRDATGKPGVAARLATEHLRTQWVRGFLTPAEVAA